jgi:CDP-diacylglycerol--glycerol-3-phosphate 3-phosphatidyltransferase
MTHKMNIPNRLTIARFCMSIVIIVLMVIPYEELGWTPTPIPTTGFNVIDLVCCVLFVIASITDTLDGNIARSQHLISDFGKFMDPLADKALVNTSLIILAVKKPDWLPAIIVILMIIRDIAVDGLRFICASRGKVISASYWGKSKTVAQMIAIPFIYANGFPFNYLSLRASQIFTIVLASIACALSLVSGFIYIYNGRQFISDTDHETDKKEGE